MSKYLVEEIRHGNYVNIHMVPIEHDELELADVFWLMQHSPYYKGKYTYDNAVKVFALLELDSRAQFGWADYYLEERD